jgi:acyl-CoA reductase-like NAD-dependent aldehyde dehydrogenase
LHAGSSQSVRSPAKEGSERVRRAGACIPSPRDRPAPSSNAILKALSEPRRARAAIRTEEIFGPVAPIYEFDTEEQVLAAANATEYGLASYVFTRDLSRALRVADALDTGLTGINRGVVSNPVAPFGGIKASGIGREGSIEGLDAYLETKYTGIEL